MNVDGFFANPNFLTALVAVVIVLANLTMVWFQNRNNKKVIVDNQSRSSDIVGALNKQSMLLQILVDKEINSLNSQSAEEVITSSLRRAENTIKDEVIRIFEQNNRNNSRRQAVIKRAIHDTVNTMCDTTLNSLGRMTHKENKLSDYIVNFDRREFITGLLDHIFEKGESDKQDMTDTLYFIKTYFTSVITGARLNSAK